MKLLLIAALFACALELHAEEAGAASTQRNGKAVRADDVRMILESGIAANALPSGVIIRVRAKLGRVTLGDPKLRTEAERRGVDFKKHLDETWEFTSTQVHLVIHEESDKGGAKPVDRRVGSRPFDTTMALSPCSCRCCIVRKA
jgi:hypothetical protein